MLNRGEGMPAMREHPVLKAIIQRRKERSVPGLRQDGFKVRL